MKTPRRMLAKTVPILIAMGLLATARAGETNSTAIAYSDVSDSLASIEFLRGGEVHQALGVIVTMGGKPYLVTTQRTLLGAERLKFTTATGETLAPRSVELSSNYDLARLALPERKGALTLAEGTLKKATAIHLPRTSDLPKNRIEHGAIEAIGGMKFEISIAFGEDDFGAPILNTEGQVVGLASHNQESSSHAMKKGTRFDGATRHFCYRVTDKGWQSVNWRNFNSVFGSAYMENAALGEEIIAVFEKTRGEVSTSRASELATQCRVQARKIDKLAGKQGMTDYLRNQLEDQAELFEFAEEFFHERANR